MNFTAVLYVEENTEAGKEAIKLMTSSTLPYQVFHLKKEEADKHRKDLDKIPMLMSKQGIFRGLEDIECYSKCYGKGGPQYSLSC